MKTPSGIPLTMKYCENSPAYSETVQAKASASGNSPGRLSFYSLYKSRKKVSYVTLLFVMPKNYSQVFAWSRSFQFLGITLFSAYDPKCRIRHLGSTSTRSTFLPSMARPTPRFSQVVVLPVPPFWLVMAITVAFWAKSSPPFTPAGAGYFAFRSCCTRAA